MMRLKAIITTPEESWASREGMPKDRLEAAGRSTGPGETRWNPRLGRSQWGSKNKMPMRGESPVANTAPKIPISSGKMKR